MNKAKEKNDVPTVIDNNNDNNNNNNEQKPIPPPIPRRPSLKILNKLKSAMSQDKEINAETDLNGISLSNDNADKESDTNTTITATKIESKREIYYGNHTLLFASTEAGGFFLGSDDDGYAILSDIPTPVCFTNARNPFLRYGDIVRVMAHNCNLIGHTSNSWMSWSKDVGSVAGLYRITPPDGVDTITRTFRFGAPVEYGMPFMLYSDNWKTNIIGMVLKNGKSSSKRLALNNANKKWLEPLTFMCQIYKPDEPKEITEAKLVTKSRASSEPYGKVDPSSLRPVSNSLSTTSKRTKNLDTVKDDGDLLSSNNNNNSSKNNSNGIEKKTSAKNTRMSMMENMKNTFTKAAKQDSSREELKIKVDNVKAMHNQLNKRGKKKQNDWKKEYKKIVEMQLKAAEEAKRLLEEDLKKLSSNNNNVESENDNTNDDKNTNANGSINANDNIKNMDIAMDRSEFLDIENLIKATTSEIIKLKLQLYCPKALRFNHSFHFNGYFFGMEDYAIQKVALSFHLSFTSPSSQNPYPNVKLELKPFTVILKAFGLKLVTESNEGVKQSTRSFKELTINTDIVLDTKLKFCTKEQDEKDRISEEKDNKKKVSTVSAVDVKIVNKVDQDGSKMDTSNEKETKSGSEKDIPTTNVDGDDDMSCSWIPISYRCDIVKAMDDEGKEGGFIPSIVKKLANYYLPSFVKEYILWYLTNDFGIYLRKYKNQSFTIKGEFTLDGTKLSVLKSNITKNNDNSKEALKLLGNLTFSQAKLLMKLREVIGKPFGSLWQTKWDCVHALKTYVQHMHGHMETKEEWSLFKEAWQNLVDHIYAPPGEIKQGKSLDKRHCSMNGDESSPFSNNNTPPSSFNTSVLNIGEIFENILTLMRKPVYATLSLNSVSAKLNLNKFSKMQRDVALFAIQRSLELENNSSKEGTSTTKEKKDGSNKGDDDGRTSPSSLRAQRHQIAINLLEEWYDNRVDTLDFIGHCIRTLKTDVEVKLSGGANGLLSILLNDINLSLPENVYLMMRKKLLMPSVDGNVLNVIDNKDGSGGGKYVIEYNAPLAAMDNEAKKELGNTKSPRQSTMMDARRNNNDNNDDEDTPLARVSTNEVFKESPDFPGYIRVLLISMEEIRIKLCMDRKELIKKLLLEEEQAEKEGTEKIMHSNMYDLSNITFLQDVDEQGAYKINWTRPDNSFMFIDIQKLNILGSPSRITHYSKATLKPLKEQMRALAFEDRERSNSDGKLRRASMKKLGRRRNSRKNSVDSTDEEEDENTTWYKNLIQKIRQYMLSPDLEVNMYTQFEIDSGGKRSGVVEDVNDNDVHAVLLPTNGKIKMSFSIEEIAMDLGLKERQEF